MLVMAGATACQAIDESRKPAMATPPLPEAPKLVENWPPQTFETLVGGWTLTDDEGRSCLVVLGAAAASGTTLGAEGTACPVKIAEWSYKAPNIRVYAGGSKELGTLRAAKNEVAFAGELRVSGGGRKKVRLVQAGRSVN
jgi:hypothetical protein